MIYASTILLLAIAFIDCSCSLTPVTSKDGSGVDTLEENITLQYCVIDNFTILRLDTGEQLDIIYTKDSILVVTTNDSQTTIAVPRLYGEPVCSMDDYPRNMLPTSIYIVILVWTASFLSLTGYNVIKHLLYKKLHNPMGKLLMTYSIFLAINWVSFFMIITLLFKFPVNLNHMCHIVKLIFMTTDIGYEATATCILVHCAYNLRQSYKIIPSDLGEDKTLLRRYFGYIIGTITVSMFMILTYDLGVSASKGNFDGRCSPQDPIYNASVTIMFAIAIGNGLVQIAVFILYLYYWYKMWNSQHITNYQINRKLFNIAVGMGATISIANFIFFVNWISSFANGTDLSNLVENIGALMLFLQHCIIVGLLKWVKKICKKKMETMNTII